VLSTDSLETIGLASIIFILGKSKTSPTLRVSPAIQSDQFLPQANLSSLSRCFNLEGWFLILKFTI
jgi:hypothetical protein